MTNGGPILAFLRHHVTNGRTILAFLRHYVTDVHLPPPAIESNISVAFYISISVLLSYRLKQSSSSFGPIDFLLVVAASHQFLVKFLVNFFVILDSPSVTGLLFSFLFVTCVSFFTHRFGLLSSEKNK
eukprot:TRINITY_DN4967_c0_g2_i4.p1 TRINITY_DN4967_c0_g2~~TRINITY_DN4967_c0_g2_i4.p1  ORF type:complete len:128 (+),score=15.76 TRINITY_DN4967_c0_g2_i4:495-878(+)